MQTYLHINKFINIIKQVICVVPICLLLFTTIYVSNAIAIPTNPAEIPPQTLPGRIHTGPQEIPKIEEKEELDVKIKEDIKKDTLKDKKQLQKIKPEVKEEQQIKKDVETEKKVVTENEVETEKK